MALSKNDLNLILGVVIPNMDNGFEIKTRSGEIFKVDPNWECCQEFMEALKAEMINQLNQKPHRVYGYN
ncbi:MULTISPECIES: hypothetical protein [Enterobacteriaceae]|uniref:hypothetical protein n=1 Tax=Enterobacteriaceae TaxID=543 RepID=UPI000EED436F|nr:MULTISPECIES: hypothetical protein [Enterobacteriaceae]EDV0343400.1 hypothetical protein [Salmonella enterica subsp. enterica serovar Minnesota]MCQ4970000.1 hypothetical protein [Enterobacteriaceae bacterium DFI.7.85]HCC77062.1 hypothetical protein [Shigella sp.]MDU7390280.1 hypothetical protein [Atlantibacter hermannii]MDW4578425.1 hypothetical protein [Atlantibacter hermannii]